MTAADDQRNMMEQAVGLTLGATNLFKVYQAYIDAGFTEEQAYGLTVAVVSSLAGGAK